jgi:hypothetical protein
MPDVFIPADSLIFTRSIVLPGDRDAAYRRVQRGELCVVTRGVLAESASWNAALPEERHRAAARAIAELRPEAVFGGITAALIWGRPWVGRTPVKPIVISNNVAGGNSDRSTTVMASTVAFDVECVDGLSVTGLARTLVDVARRCDQAISIPMLDHALSAPREGEVGPAAARLAMADLALEFGRGTHIGRARARASLTFADGLSASIGESLSRLAIAQLGFTQPVLQQRYVDREGVMFGDFSWGHERVIGEFDGLGKYLREEFTHGRGVTDVVMSEKRREDRLRALGFRVARWGWREVQEPHLLARILEDAGLRRHQSASPRRSRRRS